MQVSADPKDLGLCPERLERVDGWMRRLVDDGRLAGLSVSVMRRGQLAFARAHGLADLKRGTPFRLDTVARIYSMTKPLTSVAVMQLYEEAASSSTTRWRASCRNSPPCASRPAATGPSSRPSRRAA